MRRRLLIGCLALLGLFVGTASADASGGNRLDALAATLRERPLAIDPELVWLLDSDQKRRILRAVEGSPIPIFVAAVPQLETDESGGDPNRIATALHRRLGRTGLYVLIDQRGLLSTLAFSVPRRGVASYKLSASPPENERDPSFTAVRVERLVNKVVALPPGDTTEEREPRPLEPFVPTFGRRPDREEAAASFGGTALGAGFVFGILGLIAGGVLRRLETRRRRREAAAARAAKERRLREAAKLQRRKEDRRRRDGRPPWWRRMW